jgi:histone-lysine N-methyltransferase SETDB1
MYVLHYALTETNESLNTEIRGVMHSMDKLRNQLYEDFRPQIKMLEEVEINDGAVENIYPIVATKKVTQMRIPSTTLQQDSQLEIVAIEPSDTKKIAIPKLPRIGPLMKRAPVIDDIVYIMKNSVMPWIKAKVYMKCAY